VEPTLPANALPVSLTIRDTRRGSTRTVPVRHPVTLIGSRPGCRIQLPSSKVSPVHCALVHMGDRVLVRDLASRAGTRVNDWETDEQELSSGDRLSLHCWELTVCVDSPPSEASDGNHGQGVSSAGDAESMVIHGAEGEVVHTSRKSVVLMGRHRRCDFRLEDAQASRAHALFARIDGAWTVTDLLSTNGTEVNGRRVESCLPLGRNVEVRVGPSGPVLRVTTVPDAPPSADADEPATPGDAPSPSISLAIDPLVSDDTVIAEAGSPNGTVSTDAVPSASDEPLAEPENRDANGESNASLAAEPEAQLQVREQTLVKQEHALRERLVRLEQNERWTSRFAADLEARQAELKRERTNLQTERTDLRASATELAHKEEHLSGLAAELDGRKTDLDRRGAELEAEEKDFQERFGELQDFDREMTAQQQRLAAASESLAATQRRTSEHESLLRRQAADLEEAQHGLEEQGRVLDEQKKRLDGRRGQLEEAERDLARRVAGASQAIDVCKRRVREIEVREKRLAERRAELDARHADLRTRDGQLRATREQLHRERTVHDEVARSLAERERQVKQTEAAWSERQRRLDAEARAVTGQRQSLQREFAAVEETRRELEREQEDLARRQEQQRFADEELSRRGACLDERSEALEAKEAKLATEQRVMQQQTAQLQQRVQHLQAALEAARARQDQADAARAAFERREAALSQREAELERRVQAAEPQEKAASAPLRSLEAQRRGLVAAEQQLAARREHLDAREQELTAESERQRQCAALLGEIGAAFERLHAELLGDPAAGRPPTTGCPSNTMSSPPAGSRAWTADGRPGPDPSDDLHQGRGTVPDPRSSRESSVNPPNGR
jgi:pSer/pThr/pTyr-binding forkhead associated (FHA) protein